MNIEFDNFIKNLNTNTNNITDNIKKIHNNFRLCHHKVKFLYKLREYLKHKATNYLEIGVHNGCSMSYILSSKYPINCYGIDLFSSSKYSDKLDKYIINNRLEKINEYHHKIELIEGDSTQNNIINKIDKLNLKFDIIFIDGDHSYEGVKKDFNNYYQFLNSQGVLIFDDFNEAPTNAGVFKFINELLDNYNKYFNYYYCYKDELHTGKFKNGIIAFFK